MAALLQPVQAAQGAIREDLADYIAVVDAKSTPFSSMIPKGKELGNVKFDWQVDNYSSPILGGWMDGLDIAAASLSNASANRFRLENFSEVFQRDFRVGFVAETQDVAGVTDEVARSVSKRMLELKRDMENTLLMTNQPAVPEAGALAPPPGGQASMTSSLGNWLTSVSSNTPGSPPTAYSCPPGSKYTGVAANITETDVQNILESIYNQTGTIRDYDLICGTTVKRAFTNLMSGTTAQAVSTNNIVATAVRTFNMELTSDTYKHSVDVFEGDFGTLMLHPDVFCGSVGTGITPPAGPTGFTVNSFKGYVIPMEMCELRYTQLPKIQDLPDMGGGPSKLIRAIAGLVVKNPLGFGMFNCSA